MISIPWLVSIFHRVALVNVKEKDEPNDYFIIAGNIDKRQMLNPKAFYVWYYFIRHKQLKTYKMKESMNRKDNKVFFTKQKQRIIDVQKKTTILC